MSFICFICFRNYRGVRGGDLEVGAHIPINDQLPEGIWQF